MLLDYHCFLHYRISLSPLILIYHFNAIIWSIRHNWFRLSIGLLTWSWIIRIKLTRSAANVFLFNPILKNITMVLSLIFLTTFFLAFISNFIISFSFLLSSVSLHQLLLLFLIHSFWIHSLTRFHLRNIHFLLSASGLVYALFDSIGRPVKRVIKDITRSVSHITNSLMCFSTFWTSKIITFIIFFNNNFGFLFIYFHCAISSILFYMLRVSHLMQKDRFLFIIIFFLYFILIVLLLIFTTFFNFFWGDWWWFVGRTLIFLRALFIAEKEHFSWWFLFIWFLKLKITLHLKIVFLWCFIICFSTSILFDNWIHVLFTLNLCFSRIYFFLNLIILYFLLIRIGGSHWSLSSRTRLIIPMLHLIAKVKLVVFINLLMELKQALFAWVDGIVTIGFFVEFSISSSTFRYVTSFGSVLWVNGFFLSFQLSWLFRLLWLQLAGERRVSIFAI